MGDASAASEEEEESRKNSSSIFLQIVENVDGSITRPTVLNLPPNPVHDPAVLSKDLPLNPTLNTSLRLFLPISSSSHNNNKLPIIVYYHGGGFVLFSPDFVLYHQFCLNMAAALPALIVSLDYRLAPENCLPAAYDDAVDALRWVSHSTDPWIVEHGDISRCFLMGSSSGGNMAYFASLRAAKLELDPMKVCGVVLIQPYLGGEQRTESEMESGEDDILPLRANDMMWRMALPLGATRDHPFCNIPLAAASSTQVLLPNIMIIGCKGDPLFDRQKMFVQALTAAAAPGTTKIVDHLEENEKGYHAIELFDPARADAMFAHIRDFIS